MEKKTYIMILAIVFLTFVIVGLSGCDEFLDETGSTDKVELLLYSVETQREEGFEKIDDGFVDDDEAYRYAVSGTVKNLVNETLSHVRITVLFYDENDTYLVSRVANIYYLDESQTGDFEVYYYNSEEFFGVIDHVNFSISV